MDGQQRDADYLSPEERALLSQPSFRISGAGGGRPQGPASRALQSGEALTQAVRGASMMPYNLLGAGVDLMSLPLSALGYDEPAPVGGSEWFKRQAREAGVAAAPHPGGRPRRARPQSTSPTAPSTPSTQSRDRSP
jgi:hypothetical protein